VEVPPGYSSWQIFDKMLRDIQVVITPGVGFGSQGEDFFRVSAFNSRDNAREVGHRFKEVAW
jgi:LL-diaminopimelate aminotransferase